MKGKERGNAMRSKTYLFTMLLGSFFLLNAIPARAATNASVVGQYGFDWLKPKTVKCTLITDAVAATFKSCEAAGPNSPGSFTGKKDYYTCTISKNSVYMVYPTKARCTDELETMKANGD